MRQVFANVIHNAIRYNRPQGRIVVSLGQRAVLYERLRHPVASYVITILDEGCGIPDDELDKVFDRFVQSSKSKTNAGGTGLGLAVAREIVLMHQGRISAKNNHEGPGVTVTIFLPTRQGEPEG
jgi:signal transduction histidine kinase